jgi:hypothetical protein
MRSMCSTHLILNIIIVIINGDMYEYNKLRNSSSYVYFQSLITSPLLDLKILLSTRFSRTLNICYSLNVGNEVSPSLCCQKHLTGRDVVIQEESTLKSGISRLEKFTPLILLIINSLA